MNAVAKVVKFESLAEIKEPQDSKVRMTENGYFEMPNSVIDDLASVLSDPTFKIYCVMIRKTFGWGKESDKLSISQIMEISSKARSTVIKSCLELESLGLVTVAGHAERGVKIYQVNKLTSTANGLVQEMNQSAKCTSSSTANGLVLVQEIDTQKKTPQKKIKESITAVMSTDNDSDNILPAVLDAEQAQPAAKKPAKPVDKEKRAANVACWAAYSIAYANRYGVDPIRNAKTNSMIAKFVEYVGRDDAPLIAAHYLTDNSFFYTNSGHDLSLLLRDFQKLRQQWITGRKSTATQARQADETQSRLSAFDSLAAKYAAEQE